MNAAKPSEFCVSAAYGQACAECVRRNFECMLRQDGAGCERCHRLGRQCEPSADIRKRKSRSPPPGAPNASRPRRNEPATAGAATSRPDEMIEEIIDDLVSSIRAQTASDSMQEMRAADGGSAEMSPVAGDIKSASRLWDVGLVKEEWGLHVFRDVFIRIFPFVHLDDDLSSSKLFKERPFLWLVIMALTEQSIATQFSMEETIWSIISRRIVAEQLADLDLLLGLIAFTNWSHVFKRDKPFASMTLQLAVAMARELDLHREAPTPKSYRTQDGQLVPQMPATRRQRAPEERRTMLALFQVSSSVWACFRKVEPLAWTPYLGFCLLVLKRRKQTVYDAILITQVRCQYILNQLSCPSQDSSPGRSSEFITTRLLRQLQGIRQIPEWHPEGVRSIKMYLLHVELAIKGLCLDRPDGHQTAWQSAGRGLIPTRILWGRELDATLVACEKWITAFRDVTHPIDWVASLDLNGYVQMTHCLVQLFRLHTLPDGKKDRNGNREPSWNFGAIRRRADVFKVLDTLGDDINKVPEAYGMVDAPGPRSGLFFKAPRHLRMIKEMMLSKLPEHMKLQRQQEQCRVDKEAQEKGHSGKASRPSQQQRQPQSPESLELAVPQPSGAGADGRGSVDLSGDVAFLDDFVVDQASEPWIMDFLGVEPWATADQSHGLYYVPDSEGC